MSGFAGASISRAIGTKRIRLLPSDITIRLRHMTETTKSKPGIIDTSPARDSFVKKFGSVYEHSPWVAETVFDTQPKESLDDPAQLQNAMRAAVEHSSPERKLHLIRQHPDLADPAAKAGKLSAMSNQEQSNAGLTQTSPEEAKRFAELNTAYKDKFGFPFVVAVKGLDREQILSAFKKRLNNDNTQEMRTALDQIHRIASFRLAEIFSRSHGE